MELGFEVRRPSKSTVLFLKSRLRGAGLRGQETIEEHGAIFKKQTSWSWGLMRAACLGCKIEQYIPGLLHGLCTQGLKVGFGFISTYLCLVKQKPQVLRLWLWIFVLCTSETLALVIVGKKIFHKCFQAKNFYLYRLRYLFSVLIKN